MEPLVRGGSSGSARCRVGRWHWLMRGRRARLKPPARVCIYRCCLVSPARARAARAWLRDGAGAGAGARLANSAWRRRRGSGGGGTAVRAERVHSDCAVVVAGDWSGGKEGGAPPLWKRACGGGRGGGALLKHVLEDHVDVHVEAAQRADQLFVAAHNDLGRGGRAGGRGGAAALMVAHTGLGVVCAHRAGGT